MHIDLYNDAGICLFGYDFSRINGNALKQSIWTTTDRLNITRTKLATSIRADFVLNDQIYTLEYTDDNELEEAKSLYLEYGDTSGAAKLTSEQQILLDKYAELVNFMETNQSTIKNNTDGAVASYLMADENFLKWLPRPGIMPVSKSPCGVIGDIAGIATLSCLAPPGPWTVICIPAMGVSLACAVAGVLDWLFN